MESVLSPKPYFDYSGYLFLVESHGKITRKGICSSKAEAGIGPVQKRPNAPAKTSSL